MSTSLITQYTRPYLQSRARRILLLLILLLAASLRLANLGGNIYGYTSDHASVAYDAYSILHTARDRYGVFLPIYGKGFNAWGPTLQCYLLVGSIGLFGLTEFATLLPSVLLGILTVLLTYLTVNRRLHNSTALWAAFLLTISPWHIHLSRSGTEIPLLPCFFMLGLYLFYLGIERNTLYLYLSAAGFACAFYTYYPSRIFVPLAGIGLVIIYRKELALRKTAALCSIALFVLALLPATLFALLDPQHFFLRYQQIGVTTSDRTFTTAILLFGKNYLAHLSPVFLFFRGDANVRNFPQGFGQLYMIEAPLILIGIIACLRNIKNPDARFLVFWLLTYGIPASLTVENIPHGTRTVMALPLYQIIAAVGIYCVTQGIGRLSGAKRKLALASAALFIALFGINAYAFFRHYFFLWPVYSARALDYGWREAFAYARSVENQYNQIILTVLSVGPPTMFPPFYLKYDPAEYQRSGIEKSKYRFVYPEKMWATFIKSPGNTLFIVREEELRGIPPKKTVSFPDGAIAFKIIEQRN